MQLATRSIPAATEDMSQIQRDLTSHGVALLANALTSDSVTELQSKLHTQAEYERRQGVAFLEDGNLGKRGIGPNQRVFSLIKKGEVFRSLATDKRALDIVRDTFAASYELPQEMVDQAQLDAVLLSSLTANIVCEDGVEMMKHADQAFVPASTPYPAVINVIWLLNDFTAENGATLVAPGTHIEPNPHKFYLQPPPMVCLQATAGTAVFLDGRTWHGTGINRTASSRSAIFAYYCRPFIRQQENFALTLSETQREELGEGLRKLLGFSEWFTLGASEKVAVTN